MESAQDTFTLDDTHNSQIKLSQTNNRLVIAVESRNRYFSLELDNDDDIPKVSDEVFSDINSMYQGFVAALQKVNDKINLSFDDGNGQLICKASFSAGEIPKDRQFSLDLQEKEPAPLAPLTIIERNMEGKFNQILEKVSALEKRVAIREGNQETNGPQSGLEMKKELGNNLLDMMVQFQTKILEKLERLQEKIVLLEQKTSNLEKEEAIFNKNNSENLTTSIKSCIYFDSTSPKAVDYVFSNHNQTAQCQKLDNSTRELPLSQPLPKTGKFEVSIQIDIIQVNLWIGIVSPENLQKKDWHKQGLYFLSSEGSIYTPDLVIKPKISSVPCLKTGDIVTLKADIDQGVIAFLINDDEINSTEINLKGTTFVPYVGFSFPQNKFTILN